MQIKKVVSLILMLALALFIFTSCGKNFSDDTPPDTEGDVSVNDDSSWQLKIDTVTLDGDPVTDADFSENTLTVFNVWATWCPPCVAELPHLQEVSEAFQDRGVEIVGVMQDGVTESGKPDKSTIKKGSGLLADSGVKYKVILPDETLTLEFINKMQYFPTTFFLDSNGNVVKAVTGAREAKDWEKMIDEILKDISK